MRERRAMTHHTADQAPSRAARWGRRGAHQRTLHEKRRRREKKRMQKYEEEEEEKND